MLAQLTGLKINCERREANLVGATRNFFHAEVKHSSTYPKRRKASWESRSAYRIRPLFWVGFVFIQSSTTIHPQCIDIATGLEEDGCVVRKENQMKKENRMNMNIRKFLGTSALSVALLVAGGIPGLAKSSGSVTFSHDVVVNGATLPAGEYTVQWETHSPEATVEFVQHRKVVLSTEGKVEGRKGFYRSMTLNSEGRTDERTNAYGDVAVVYNTASDGTMSLVEIHFAFSNKALVFNPEPQLKAAR